MLALSGFAAGLLFGLGLIVSNMVNPEKVLGFLDLAGRWDPSLAFVMGGAVAIGAIAFALTRRASRSLLGAPISWPASTRIDRALVLGSALFGVGWGLAGFCPGPALVAASSGQPKAWLFVLAMLAGMGLHTLTTRLRAAHA
ncbi:MAG TPA: YeeE/YedE family protein [Trinickia sp.]|uniref:YeeE/YedE family protein n=1 Tax=Trinickia sp. TaxID=2571163 RepID=UPI002BB42A61|nr:YeeE/YedE family protein [Trinickia sp.]HVW51795.1 YeeE/YedE family protein [Trinickia sp.]